MRIFLNCERKLTKNILQFVTIDTVFNEELVIARLDNEAHLLVTEMTL